MPIRIMLQVKYTMKSQNNNVAATCKEKADYHVIYEQFVEPTISICLAEIDDDNFKKQFSPTRLGSEEYEKKYAKKFRECRRNLKDLFYGDDEHHFLNPPKLAAVLCRTIIECKPIKFSNTSSIDESLIGKKDYIWLANNLFVNYKVAFLSSISLIYAQILAEKEPNINSDFIKHGNLAKYGLYDGNSFQTNMIVNLARNALMGKEFDDLMFALMMFQWHEYTLNYYNLIEKNES